MITSAMQTDEIKIQSKAERNVERKLLLNEERKTDATVKKDNFEGNDDLVVSRKIFNNTHGNDKKKSAGSIEKQISLGHIFKVSSCNSIHHFYTTHFQHLAFTLCNIKE